MPSTFQSPAKINLSLRVLRRREDGFHEIDSLMTQLPGLADTIEINPAESFTFTCSDPTLGTGEDNLVVRAVHAFQAASGISCDCHIHLEKRIPHGAGLGGGSSNAATTLLGLNRLHGKPLAAGQLLELAAGLGSDVPFFLQRGPAHARGRGERIEPAAAHPPLDLLLLKPAFPVATPDAYRRWLGSRDLPDMPHGPAEVDGIALGNDLERPVFAKHLFLAELKAWLLARPEVRAAQLCGSGSTVFAILRDPDEADALASAARTELDPTLWSWAGKS